MREYIESNGKILEEILKIDNQIMFASLTVEELVEHAQNKSPYSFQNALLIYDGDPFTTLKIMNSEIENCTLYPNYSYLGINRFLASYKEGILLSTLKNDFFYEEGQNFFQNVILVNAGATLEEWLQVYPKAIAIEI